ncbi:MAG: LamG domain-containing protein [Thermoguttaceae bacterium]|nr:LamG domain-containing protein [Thermoguttaceae bacterium]
MLKSSVSFRMFSPVGALAMLLAFCFAASASAEVVSFFNDFTAGHKSATSFREDNTKASLAPYFYNFAYFDGGGSNLRYGTGDDGYIELAAAYGQSVTFQITANSILSTAKCFDLTAGDLVYEAYYACDWTGTGAGGYHHGTNINNNQMRLLYHPGYTNGAFRIEGQYGTCSNQNIGFTPPVAADKYTMMKVTVHRDEDAGNYVFKTEFGLATDPETGGQGSYTYSYTHTCPIATIDADGGIKSIGPYAYHNANNRVTNIKLNAPFGGKALETVTDINNARDYFIETDKPVHWYKFDGPETQIVKDYGSNPKDGTSENVNMSSIHDLNPIGEFSGSASKVTISNAETIVGPWTAEFLLNSARITSWLSLLTGGNYSLRLGQYSGLVPGYTHFGVKDYNFLALDGSAYDTPISQNEWHHVTYVNDGENMLFYLDGSLVGTSNEELIPLTFNNIGSGGEFAGAIDYVALYDYALNPTQIWNHANPVPEPAAWAMLLFGAAGLLCLSKRKAVAVRS